MQTGMNFPEWAPGAGSGPHMGAQLQGTGMQAQGLMMGVGSQMAMGVQPQGGSMSIPSYNSIQTSGLLGSQMAMGMQQQGISMQSQGIAPIDQLNNTFRHPWMGTAPVQSEEAKELAKTMPAYDNFFDLFLAGIKLLELRFLNVDQDRAGWVWYENVFRFAGMNGCNDEAALMLQFERNDLDQDGCLGFVEYLALMANSTDPDVKSFFNVKPNAHVVIEMIAAVKKKYTSHDKSRSFGLESEEAHNFWREELPELYNSALYQECYNTIMTPERVAANYGWQLQDILYCAYLAFFKIQPVIKGPMIYGTYANPKMMAGPARNFASLVACFKQLEKDFKLLDFKNADDGFIYTFSIGANFGNRVKPAAADVVQRFSPLVAECDNDGGKTLSFF